MENINFYGDVIHSFRDSEREDSPVYVVIKPIAKSLGLNWDNQLEKLKADSRAEISMFEASTVNLKVPGSNQIRQVTVIPLKYLPYYLATISTNHIPDLERRRKVALYQKECSNALYDYWFKGIAVNTRELPSDIDSAIATTRNYLGDLLVGIDDNIYQRTGHRVLSQARRIFEEYTGAKLDDFFAGRPLSKEDEILASLFALWALKDLHGLADNMEFINDSIRRFSSNVGPVLRNLHQIFPSSDAVETAQMKAYYQNLHRHKA